MIAKRILNHKRRFGTRFRQTVITYAVLTQNEWKTHFGPKRRLALDLEKQLKLTQFSHKMNAKRIFQQNRRFGTRFRETVITYAVLTPNECKAYL